MYMPNAVIFVLTFQGVRARMVGIDSLDVTGFFKEYKILSQPFKVALQVCLCTFCAGIPVEYAWLHFM